MPGLIDSPPVSSRQALADITFAPRAGKTRLTRVVTRAPLAVQRALYLNAERPRQAWVTLANPAAGLLAGDDHEIHITLKAGAEAHVTTQAAAKVFSMPDGRARQRVVIDVGADASLEYVPGPVIPYRDAELEQVTEVTVAPTGLLVMAELLSPGRSAHGERFAYRSVRNRLTIRRPDGTLLHHEAAALRPTVNPEMLVRLHPGSDIVVTLVVVSPCTDETVTRSRMALMVADHRSDQVGIAVLPNGGGLLMKALAADVQSANRLVQEVWRQIHSITAAPTRA